MIKIKGLEMRDYPAFSRWAQLNHMSPHKQKLFWPSSEDQREMAA